ncbi:membrane dipeptidase [Agrilutibacter solisilvae]|uniref:Membrane dipeptidase n=1 Tax=Agrilutibacter solisilvae TaxID=2763317 RepID=A0A974XZ10_9GAMM|nr:membrane dipeptidase [Lysobacter solisilvae]QSX77508.1 membrane dipeptidase [Lysobacter solisilvae]
MIATTGGCLRAALYAAAAFLTLWRPALACTDSKVLWDFENGSESGWTSTGAAFIGQPMSGAAYRVQDVLNSRQSWPFPTPPRGRAWNTAIHHGFRDNGWISSGFIRPSSSGSVAESSTGSSGRTGQLTSDPFTISCRYLTFLISGKKDPAKLRVQLLVRDDAGSLSYRDGRYSRVALATGRNHPMMRRDWFDANSYRGQTARLEIVDQDTDPQLGHINVDDFRVQDVYPPQQTNKLGTQSVPAIVAAPQPLASPNPLENGWVDRDAPIWGLVDLHTHPMAHLGFGKHVVHGAPDIGSLVPAGTRDCNETDFRSRTIYDALGHDNSTHGGAGVDNPCGNYIRNAAIRILDAANEASSNHGADKLGVGKQPGVAFSAWPAHDDITHQQMWFEWIKRARDGGLRVLVALAINNKTIADISIGNEPKTDYDSARLQIDELKLFVARHSDFMEVAYTPTDLRRIVRSGKLAVVVGVEIDSLLPPLPVGSSAVKMEVIEARIQALVDRGVRYLFPIHLLNNAVGGTATYVDVFNASNRLERGEFWQLECAPEGSKISYRFGIPGPALELMEFALAVADDGGAGVPQIPSCVGGSGHRNTKGLSDLGTTVLTRLMRRGLLLDIDHMSERSANATIALAQQFGYPLNSGHNEPRAHTWNQRAAGRAVTPNENNRTDAQLSALRNLGGMFGVGWGGTDACTYKDRLTYALNQMQRHQVGLGSDVNGLIVHPAPRFGARASPTGGCSSNKLTYEAGAFHGPEQAVSPDSSTVDDGALKVWNYNNEGMAHYGLLPDFLEDLNNVGTDLAPLYGGAESFARMWEQSLRASACVSDAGSPSPSDCTL